MPISSFANLQNLIDQALAALRVRLPGKNTDIYSYLGIHGRAWGMGLFGLQRKAEAIDRESPPNTKTSDLGIQTWATISGVPSNKGAAQYGQNGATISTGGQAPVTGTASTVVLDGQQLVGADGVTIFQLVGNVTIPATGVFKSVTAGAAANLPVGAKLTWLTPPTGCDASVTLSSPLVDGEDEETIPHLFGRLQDRWQAPPKGGANIDYKEWAGVVDGVADVFVYSRRGGTTTVHVVITAAGVAASRIPSGTLIDTVQARLDSLKPTDVDEVIVMGPEMPTTHALTLRATAFLATGYTWDWDDTGGSWTVAGWNATTKVLSFSAALPQSLKNAIDNGEQPLVMVVNSTTGSPIVCEQIRALSYVGTDVTLAAAFSVNPTNGDEIHAGAYAAPAAAQAMLDYVTALGPSRVSGFGDAVQPWQDIVSVWGSGNAALRAADTDGTIMLSRLQSSGGLLIQIGSGSPAATDFEPPDTYTLPPELALPKRMIVVQAAP